MKLGTLFLSVALFCLITNISAVNVEVEESKSAKISVFDNKGKRIESNVQIVCVGKKKKAVTVDSPRNLVTKGEFLGQFGVNTKYTIYVFADGYRPNILRSRKIKEDFIVRMIPDKSEKKYAVSLVHVGFMLFNKSGKREIETKLVNDRKKLWEFTGKNGVTLNGKEEPIKVKPGTKFTMENGDRKYNCKVIDDFANQYIGIEYAEEKK